MDPAGTLPHDVQQIVDAMNEADGIAAALAARLTDEQFEWQPDGGTRWSVAQCLEHLAVTNELYGAAIAQAVERAKLRGSKRRGVLKPGIVGQRFVDSLEPPVKYRGRAPSQVKPGSKLTRAEILARYRAAHDRIRAAARDAAVIDANAATFANPFMKLLKVKVSTGLHVVCAHDRRHLWQAEQVTTSAGFPRGGASA